MVCFCVHIHTYMHAYIHNIHIQCVCECMHAYIHTIHMYAHYQDAEPTKIRERKKAVWCLFVVLEAVCSSQEQYHLPLDKCMCSCMYICMYSWMFVYVKEGYGAFLPTSIAHASQTCNKQHTHHASIHTTHTHTHTPMHNTHIHTYIIHTQTHMHANSLRLRMPPNPATNSIRTTRPSVSVSLLPLLTRITASGIDHGIKNRELAGKNRDRD
jgi:hypothetical protein